MNGHSALGRGTTVRSFDGCWTCRLRRKKCDERRPRCDGCAALHISCHYAQEKPEWMDGGARQEDMSERVKQEIKENARRRRNGEFGGVTFGNGISNTRASMDEAEESLSRTLGHLTPTIPDSHGETLRSNDSQSSQPACRELPTMTFQRGTSCALTANFLTENIPFAPSDTFLLMFYMENLFPFLFPFYQPSLLKGGRAWILEMLMGSPVVRQAALCQSSYFFSLMRGATNANESWDTVLSQTRDAFEVLRRSLQIIDGAIAEHLHGAVRIMASILQVQRFEISILCFDNCQFHLNASLALFKQLMESAQDFESGSPGSDFDAVLTHLGPSSWNLSDQSIQLPSAEQAAFRFSASLLIFDDIMASTVLQDPPQLYEFHQCLLCSDENTEPRINLEAVVGCQNWVMMQIGETAVLDTWKQRCKSSGSLDIMELVRRATSIKDVLEMQIAVVETTPEAHKLPRNILDAFTADNNSYSRISSDQRILITRVWAHAAFIYLFVVVSGWQPANIDVQHHVGQIMNITSYELSTPSLLRTMAWPLCVAGCMAEQAAQYRLRTFIGALQPSSMFGPLRKALDIMENTWNNGDVGNIASRDLAMCFKSAGDLVLLI